MLRLLLNAAKLLASALVVAPALASLWVLARWATGGLVLVLIVAPASAHQLAVALALARSEQVS